MNKQINLLEGKILPTLSALALPIMATSFIQMAYNLIDMIWIGKLGSGAVAAVGAAGMFMWFSSGLVTLAKMGGQVKVAHALGAGNHKEARHFARASIQLGIVFAIIFGIICLMFGTEMISFFRFTSPEVIKDAKLYLYITCGLVIFSFLNQIFTGILTGMGNSKISFIANSIGLVLNIILDPLCIFGFGAIPEMGVFGAGLATTLSQAFVTIVFLYAIRDDELIFRHVHILHKSTKKYMKPIFSIGLPIALQSVLFSSISMVIARIIGGWGEDAIAVQKIGSQIESISWMTAEGFAAAVNSFMAQNFGAKKMERVKQGYFCAMKVVLSWGVFCTCILFFLPHIVFRFFLQDPSVLQMGVDYLKILAISQIFMCIEITTNGAFAGLGKPIPPAINTIVLTAARIPLALILSSTILGLNGIWWSITISSIFKGIIIVFWFYYFIKKYHLFDKTAE